MANSEESNPLLPKQQQSKVDEEEQLNKNNNAPITNDENKPYPTKSTDTQAPDAVKQSVAPAPMSWTANGLPLTHGSVKPMMGRAQWDSSLCACLGRNDDFCSSDLEVCESFLLFLKPNEKSFKDFNFLCKFLFPDCFADLRVPKFIRANINLYDYYATKWWVYRGESNNLICVH